MNKVVRVTVYMSKDEHALLVREAKKHGMLWSAYLYLLLKKGYEATREEE